MEHYFLYYVVVFSVDVVVSEQEFPYSGQIILASSIQVYSHVEEKWPFFTCSSKRIGQVIGAMTTTKTTINNLV